MFTLIMILHGFLFPSLLGYIYEFVYIYCIFSLQIAVNML